MHPDVAGARRARPREGGPRRTPRHGRAGAAGRRLGWRGRRPAAAPERPRLTPGRHRCGAPHPCPGLTRPASRDRGFRTVRPQSPSRLCATDSTPGCGVPEVPDRRLRGRLAGRGEPGAGRPRRVPSSPRPAGRCGGRGGLEGSLGARPGSSICSARRTSGEARVIESELNAITPKG